MKSTRFVLRGLYLVVPMVRASCSLGSCPVALGGSLENPLRRSVIESLAPLFLPQAVKGNSPDRCHWGRQETTERESNHP